MALKRARLGLYPGRKGKDTAKLRGEPGRVNHRLCASGDDRGAHEEQVLGIQGARAVTGRDGARQRGAFPGKRRHLHLQRGRPDHSAIRRNIVPRLQGNHVPGHDLLGGDLAKLPGSHHAGAHGHQALQGGGGALRRVLLRESDRGVDHHYREYPHAKVEVAGIAGNRNPPDRKGQRRPHRQHHGEHVAELAQKLPPDGLGSGSGKAVVPEAIKAPGGLGLVEPLGAGAEPLEDGLHACALDLLHIGHCQAAHRASGNHLSRPEGSRADQLAGHAQMVARPQERPARAERPQARCLRTQAAPLEQHGVPKGEEAIALPHTVLVDLAPALSSERIDQQE